METRFTNSPKETSGMNTAELRSNFLVENLMVDNSIRLTYSHYDRMIIGGVKPVTEHVSLPNHHELRAEYFLERREMGIINVGGDGVVVADGEEFPLRKLDGLYLGKGTKNVSFRSVNTNAPALFYILSVPAHNSFPNKSLAKEETNPVTLGDAVTANRRTIYKYIHLDGLKSCQLVMGLTVLDAGSVWNTMPAHTHTRRMEVYFYFDVPDENRVVHFMGEPTETRHLFIANHEAVISPPWSIHAGCGTTNYGFIWGMAGENLVYSDMDPAPVTSLR